MFLALREMRRAVGRYTSVSFVFQTVNLVPFLPAHENPPVVNEMAGRRYRLDDAGKLVLFDDRSVQIQDGRIDA